MGPIDRAKIAGLVLSGAAGAAALAVLVIASEVVAPRWLQLVVAAATLVFAVLSGVALTRGRFPTREHWAAMAGLLLLMLILVSRVAERG